MKAPENNIVVWPQGKFNSPAKLPYLSELRKGSVSYESTALYLLSSIFRGLEIPPSVTYSTTVSIGTLGNFI
jgi:hypothetical protein